MGFFHGLQTEFETAVVDEPSVFEPVKVYCIKQILKSVTLSLVSSSEPSTNLLKARSKPGNISDASSKGILE